MTISGHLARAHAANDERADRYDAWASRYQYRPCSARCCLRVVAGGRCVRYEPNRRGCICQRHWLDHARIWLTGYGPARRYVLTFEPYQLNSDDLAALVDDLDDLGLELMVIGHSPHNPGATFLCEVTSRPHKPGLAA
ncbi:MAG: hypothetical protein GEV08_07780 [Acidimicrobiia bacterium]|nr:hypothetical protein [Acidimicrobiia bacterium]